MLHALLVVATALALGALAAPALAQGGTAAEFHRGGLPSIGEISLTETPRGQVEISVPVTYTKALSGPPRGLESSLVTLHVADELKRGRPIGTAYESSRRHGLHGTGTIVDRFTLGGQKARWLLGKSRRLRGQLLRIDVRHLVRERRGEPVLHEKDASLTMASSHRARPQGVSGMLTLRNEVNEPIKNLATPVMCMYSKGEGGSNLQAFSHEGEPIRPTGTIEAEIEADGSIFSDAEWEGESSPFAIDALGLAADVIGDALDVEAGPLAALIDIATHCESMPSTFSFVAATANGSAASSEAWVLTSQDCKYGCPHQRMISAYETLLYQHPGEQNVETLWAGESNEMLEAYVGYYTPGATHRGRIVLDNGLHFDWKETSKDQWEVKVVREGPTPDGFSG